MRYAIVYSSKTGNTRQLAEVLRSCLPSDACLYFGPPDPQALKAQRIFIGFWTDKGSCDGETAAFLKTLTHQEVFLFGTAGFGSDSAYFNRILARVREQVPEQTAVLGGFLCQGKMPPAVRLRYEQMENPSQRQRMLDNFDSALSHPDQADLARLKAAFRSLD